MTCPHERGDWLGDVGYWLCSDCWQKMESRPTRYGPSPFGSPAGSAQAIVWQASIHVAPIHKVSLSAFLRTVAKRLIRKSRSPLSLSEAYGLAIDELSALGDPFGDPAYDWSHDAARALADEAMEYWEKDGVND